VNSPPHFDVDVRHRIGTLQVDVKFSLSQPWTILFGPSGSGKTTVLRAIAGLIRPDSARIATTFVDPLGHESKRALIDTRAGQFVACHKRNVPLAAQSPALFPHMTVRQQISYGMCSMRSGNANPDLEEPGAKTEDVLALFRITDLADKFPAALSGGEAQRVSMARAAASASRLLLLDEPFSGLDMALRSEIMKDLPAWAERRNLCVLSVTHDVAEAFELNAEVIKLADGRLVEQGPVDIVLGEERARLLEQLNGAGRSRA
jgi:molybdate transport system ATP-binding protein